MNHKNDKAVWLKWMELRVNNEAKAIETPTGFIPLYKDLKQLFKQVLKKNYSEEDYIEQFTVRIPENLSKIDRTKEIFKTRVHDTPDIVFKVLDEQQKRLLEAKEKYGEYITPGSL